MILVTTEGINGRELEMLGLVKGSTIQTVNAVRDIGAGLKTLVGGELTKYNEMMNNARALATKRMVEEAEAMGALAARTVLAGKGGYMAALKRVSDDPYKCEAILVPVEELALHERVFPREWVAKDGFDVTDDFRSWCRPLLGGPLTRPFVWKE